MQDFQSSLSSIFSGVNGTVNNANLPSYHMHGSNGDIYNSSAANSAQLPSSSAFTSLKKRRLDNSSESINFYSNSNAISSLTDTAADNHNYLNKSSNENMAGHIYKENKLKMSKHTAPTINRMQLQNGSIYHTGDDAASTDYSTHSQNETYLASNSSVCKKRKFNDDYMSSSMYKSTAMVDPTCVAPNNIHLTQASHAQPHHHQQRQPLISTSNANTGIAMVATNKTNSTAAVNNSRSSTSEGDYPIIVGENLNSMSEVYEVMSFLGRGTFGQVVKCRCRTTERMVAIKILKNHPSYLRQGNVEIQILQTLSQEDTEAYNIVRAIECFQHKNHMCLVFELLEQNLYEYLKSNKFRPLSLREIRPIAQQVLTALGALKNLGLIHADLKPENIMLVHPNNSAMPYRVKVIDFGSACQSSKAVQNTYLQSRYYRAPEILLGLPFNEAIDMWSLGCVMAELFLGWPLYPGSSEYDQMRYITDTQGVPPKDMLKAAGKANRYFVREPYSYEWRLRTPEEYAMDTGQKIKEARKYILKGGLDQIREINLPPGFNSNDPGNEDVQFEKEDRKHFTILLTQMLKMRAEERIVPCMALQHPFITGSYFVNYRFSKRAHESMKLMQVCYESKRSTRSGILDPQRPLSLYEVAAVANHSAATANALSLLAGGGGASTREILQHTLHQSTPPHPHLIQSYQNPSRHLPMLPVHPTTQSTQFDPVPYQAAPNSHLSVSHSSATTSTNPSLMLNPANNITNLLQTMQAKVAAAAAFRAVHNQHCAPPPAPGAATTGIWTGAATGAPPGGVNPAAVNPWQMNLAGQLLTPGSGPVGVGSSPRQVNFMSATPNHLLMPSLASLSFSGNSDMWSNQQYHHEELRNVGVGTPAVASSQYAAAAAAAAMHFQLNGSSGHVSTHSQTSALQLAATGQGTSVPFSAVSMPALHHVAAAQQSLFPGSVNVNSSMPALTSSTHPPPPALQPAPSLLESSHAYPPDTLTPSYSRGTAGQRTAHTAPHTSTFQLPAPPPLSNSSCNPSSNQNSVSGASHTGFTSAGVASLGSAQFPIYLSSDSAESPQPLKNSFRSGKMAPQSNRPESARQKDKKSVPVGRVQPMIKEDRNSPTGYAPLAAALQNQLSYHNIMLQLAAANQTRGGASTNPSAGSSSHLVGYPSNAAAPGSLISSSSQSHQRGLQDFSHPAAVYPGSHSFHPF